MPVMVVAADTPAGEAVVARLIRPGREVRAFVSDAAAAARLRAHGVKVALGDVSDGSHVAAAGLRCHTLVLVTTGARDDRERSFASSVEGVLAAWAVAAREAGAHRVIWVTNEAVPETVPESAVVAEDGDLADLAERVAALDDAATL